MTYTLLRCKIHKAQVTHCQLDHEGSLGIDEEFLDAIGLLPYERILVGNITNGNRFETYVIKEPAGSRVFRLNGAAAHLGKPGDRLVIMSFCQVSPEEAESHQPKVLVLDNHNEPKRVD